MSSTLAPLFEPRGIAVVGASSDPAKLGSVMAATLRQGPTPVVGVNTRRPNESDGLYGSLAAASEALPVQLDLVVSCIPAAGTADVVLDAARAGAKAVLVCSGGFSEVGDAGAGPEEALLDAIERTGIRVLGPNTSGFIVPHRGLACSFVPGARDVGSGGVAVVAASGGVNHALSFGLAERGLGLRLGVGLGAGIDITQADVLEHLAGDDEVTAVALHVESVRDGRRLVRAVRELVPRVPVVALVLGQSDIGDFARSHTGALATSWRTMKSALASAGAVVVDDDRTLLDAVDVLSRRRVSPRPRPGFAVVTAQAGPGLLTVDAARAHGVDIPPLHPGTADAVGRYLPPLTYQQNPVDTGRPSRDFGAVIRAVAADSQIDGLVVYALLEPGAFDLAAALTEAGEEVPMVVATAGTEAQVAEFRHAMGTRNVPVARTASELAQALVAWDHDSRARYRLAQDDSRAGSAALATPDTFDEPSVKEVLRPFVASPEGIVCHDRAEAEAALSRFQCVVVKVVDPELTHKSDIGGVVVGVRTRQELDAAWSQVRSLGGTGVLVEKQVPDGPELILGLRRDAVFGPVVVLGHGGVAAEVLQQVVIGLAPLSATEAAALWAELPARELLLGWRGGPTIDEEGLIDLLVALSAAFASSTVDELEINPLRVLADGSVLALDAVMVPQEEKVPFPTA